MAIFPLMRDGDRVRTSDPSDDYNCAAYAAGDVTRKWWPDPEAEDYYWPPDIPRDDSLQAMVLGFQTLGFERCEDDVLEPGFQRIVIFALGSGTPQHVALQLPDGQWSSKFGEGIDATHVDLRCISGGSYGYPAVYMKRRIAPP